MSQSPTPTIDDIDISTIETGHGHISCCREQKFFCGAPFHPECADDDKEKVDCAECEEIYKRCQCGAGHQHCPLIYPHNICPSKKGST